VSSTDKKPREKPKLEDFIKMMETLRACYPQQTIGEENWRTMRKAYFLRLRSFQATVIENAMDIAWREHEQWFPSAGQLWEICRREAQKAKMNAAGAAPGAKRLPPPPAERTEMQVELESLDLSKGNPAGLIARTLERHGAEGIGQIIRDLRLQRSGTPNEGGFCDQCGYPWANHGVMHGCSNKQ
jgi:hypothetical protein